MKFKKFRHPTMKFILYTLLIVTLPSFITILYLGYAAVQGEGESFFTLMLMFLPFAGSGLLAVILYFNNKDEIEFCEHFDIGEDHIRNVIDASSASGGPDGFGSAGGVADTGGGD
ncbi:hypothetical protein [Marinobacter zhejiangensis]|uniref:Uncharacterized protein n=1 Tax=Marinobacter zhejiangensis TaxID=488535 RepID=A0A1I4T3K2_9GAMM|nr:hypothetical protein [Marinobacter zhejiangensis]SFM71207.1 hypothetical protein SAMN04487963_3471 [Marinobacter zhejiangensis]